MLMKVAPEIPLHMDDVLVNLTMAADRGMFVVSLFPEAEADETPAPQ